MAATNDVLSTLQIAEALLDAVNASDCIAWVGSGVSRPVFKDWSQTVTELCTECGAPHFDKSVTKPTADQLIDKAEECKQANRDAYEATLARIYGGPDVITRKAYPPLMKAPFKAYVTTNVDPLLSDAGVTEGFGRIFSYPDLPPREIERSQKPIFYLHGHASPNGHPSGHNLVFARSEFDEAYGPAGAVRLLVLNLLRSYPIVFVGCNLLEPEIHEQFKLVRDMHIRMQDGAVGVPSPPPRFILSHTIFSVTGDRDNSAEEAEKRRLDELGIKVLRYNPADRSKHWEIEEILNKLCSLAAKVTSAGPGEAAPK